MTPKQITDLRGWIAERRKLIAGATEGPWAFESHGDTGDFGVGLVEDANGRALCGQVDDTAIVIDPVAVEVRGACNAAFIADARQAMPDALDHIQALLAERERLIHRHDRCCGCVMSEDGETVIEWCAAHGRAVREKRGLPWDDATLAAVRLAAADLRHGGSDVMAKMLGMLDATRNFTDLGRAVLALAERMEADDAD